MTVAEKKGPCWQHPSLNFGQWTYNPFWIPYFKMKGNAQNLPNLTHLLVPSKRLSKHFVWKQIQLFHLPKLNSFLKTLPRVEPFPLGQWNFSSTFFPFDYSHNCFPEYSPGLSGKIGSSGFWSHTGSFNYTWWVASCTPPWDKPKGAQRGKHEGKGRLRLDSRHLQP